jgi:hypothetical protein
MDDRATDRAQALADEGEALFREGRLAEAEARYREAIALAPTATRYYNLGAAHQRLGDPAGAEALFRQALALEPGHAHARAFLGLALLSQGRMAEGFAAYDAWREIPEMKPKAALEIEGVPRWSGEPVAGKNIVVWGEEGFGDQIMYARFAARLREEGARVGWVCHPALVRLVQEGLGMPAVAGGGRRVGIAGADYVAPTSRLPVVFMQRLAAPPSAPYLAPPKPNVIEGLTIGVATRGNPEHDNDRNRSLGAEAAAELLALPGAVSLAPADTGARDFWDTAGIIQGLDLVISVDTSVAHLAGALGKPVWILLPALGCDWRWLSGRSDSPWYPSARLFRQTTPGDWSGVLAEIRAALAAR